MAVTVETARCCPAATICAWCGRPVCCEHSLEGLLVCEVDGLVCADCHHPCLSLTCARANTAYET